MATDIELLQSWMELQDGGLTQVQAAKFLGMSQPGLNNVLTGKSRLSKVGRQFVLHLLETVKVCNQRQAEMLDTPIPAEWVDTLYRLAGEMRERREVIEAAKTSDVYQDNSYIMADVGAEIGYQTTPSKLLRYSFGAITREQDTDSPDTLTAF